MFIKICGITSEEDALLAVAMGASAVGFVFAPSPRQVAPQIAADIVKRLPPEVLTVGVFRDEAAQRISDVANATGLQAVQLHGHEPPEVAQWLKTRVPTVIQAFAAGDARVRQAAEYGVDAILLDAPNPGSAQVFDWSLAAEVPPGQRVVIAGGLDADNVEMAIRQTRCWGVDVASGVEREPGIKDPIKVRAFIAAAREGFAAIGDQSDDRQAADGADDDPDGEGLVEVYDWQEDG
jgi:phosphoribosylanthranilate isomerase